MKNLYICLSVILLSLIGISCYDDKGNYDYSVVTPVEITGIDKEYARISFKDTLHITPNITPADGDYEYLWTLNRSYGDISVLDTIRLDTIGKEKNLNYPVKLVKGLYDVNLKVTNMTNGHSVFYNTSLTAQTEFSLGFYILKESNGNTEVDLHLPDGKLRKDMLREFNGNAMPGTPESMGLIFKYTYLNPETGEYISPTALSVCAGRDVQIFNLQDMSLIFSHSTMFYGSAPVDETPFYIYSHYAGNAYFSSDGHYFSVQDGAQVAGKFSNYPNVVDNNDQLHYQPSKSIIYTAATYNSYFFDKENHRFLACDHQGGIHAFDELGDKNAIMPHSPNRVPADYQLCFLGRNSIGKENWAYALFESALSPDKHYLYLLKLPAYGKYYNPISDVREIPASSRLNEANLYAMNEGDARLLYFVSGNQLYRYDLEGGTETPLTLQDFEGGEITYISNRYWLQKNDAENNFNHFTIATYQNGEYKVYFYDMLGGIPTGAPKKVLKGNGKAVKVQFSSPKMTDNGAGAFYPVSF